METKKRVDKYLYVTVREDINLENINEYSNKIYKFLVIYVN